MPKTCSASFTNISDARARDAGAMRLQLLPPDACRRTYWDNTMKKNIFLFALVFALAACTENSRPTTQSPETAAAFQSALGQPGLFVVDFNATWCGPCRQMKPIVEQAEKDYAGKIKFLPVDVDQNSAIAQQYNVQGIPAFFIFKDGKPLDSRVGSMSGGDFKKWLDGFVAANK